MTLMRFGTQEEAARQADLYGSDGCQSNWISIHFKAKGLNQRDRQEFSAAINGINANS